jgi:adenylate kinase
METARHRLDVYLQQTAPLIEHYRALGLLHEVNGLGDIHEVTMRLVQELGIKNGNGHH